MALSFRSVKRRPALPAKSRRPRIVSIHAQRFHPHRFQVVTRQAQAHWSRRRRCRWAPGGGPAPGAAIKGEHGRDLFGPAWHNAEAGLAGARGRGGAGADRGLRPRARPRRLRREPRGDSRRRGPRVAKERPAVVGPPCALIPPTHTLQA